MRHISLFRRIARLYSGIEYSRSSCAWLDRLSYDTIEIYEFKTHLVSSDVELTSMRTHVVGWHFLSLTLQRGGRQVNQAIKVVTNCLSART
jgi:hypothetical protein